MARATLTVDLLGACLALTEGEVGVSLERVIELGRAYQARSGRRFGITSDDLRGMLTRLVAQVRGLACIMDAAGLRDTLLEDAGPLMLSYLVVYCNDEGEHWVKAADWAASPTQWIKLELGWTDAEVESAACRGQAMAEFVATWHASPPDQRRVQRLLSEMGGAEAFLGRATEPDLA